jgi:hypothetical protein
MRHLIISLIFVTLLASCSGQKGSDASSHETKSITVKSYLDTGSAGWAYKKSDYAFVAEILGCRIQWNAVEMKEGEGSNSLGVRRTCSLPFSEQIPLHRAILKEISSKWDVKFFKNISWGSFENASDWSWCIPIAMASWKSAEYAEYRSKYPRWETSPLNNIFVKLANDTDAYQDLKKLLQEFGVTIELDSVEKIFAGKAKELPFYPALESQGLTGNPKLIYDVAFSYFTIK